MKKKKQKSWLVGRNFAKSSGEMKKQKVVVKNEEAKAKNARNALTHS